MDAHPNDTMNGVKSWQTNDVTYNITATTFSKTSRLPLPWKRPDGTPFEWFRSWNHERIANEARALELVYQKTTIPVPKLLDYGVHADGRQFLVTEFINGVTLNQITKQECSRPGGQKHTESSPCKACVEQAYSNALEFIHNIVLPQLSLLKSHKRGLDGFVMPPQWLAADIRPEWKGHHWETLPLNEAKYVFQHGDIAAHNIIIDPQTLQVRALIDWEYAGHFVPGMERWPGTLDSNAYEQRASQVADAIAEFIPIDYLACYDALDDKSGWDKLVQDGELPHPDQLR